MSRVAHTLSSKLLIVAALVVLTAGGAATAVLYAGQNGHVQISYSAQYQVTELSYDGKPGQTAMALLKMHAHVVTKHYSFGDLVTSIDGVTGNGPKYWTFYVNGKEANVGASAYVTKAGDRLTWKLQ